MITITKPFFPPVEDYQSYINKVWKNKWLTNNGDLTQELTNKSNKNLSVSCLVRMTNGVLPIQITQKLLANEGEVITTPFLYVTTTSCLVWEKCTPIFVDIHPEYLMIDDSKIDCTLKFKKKSKNQVLNYIL
ncbi:MAG: DegT/DnrJ/EryC1/StrS aminotransferase family protein [Flavobacteriales bacterium]|nr:DegT/DnrJ/EryC1/StrS aminotransferase family protein [Flavobacteriales bacterium]